MSMRASWMAICGLFTGLALSIILVIVADASRTQMEPFDRQASLDASQTIPAPEPSPTPVDESFLPAVFELVSTPALPTATPTLVITQTIPAPEPSPTPVDKSFLPAVFELVSTPALPTATPTLVITQTIPPPPQEIPEITISTATETLPSPPSPPQPTQVSTPVDRANAPIIFELARTATITPTAGPTRTPASPP